MSAKYIFVTGGVVSTSKRSLSLNPLSASPGLCDGESDATTFVVPKGFATTLDKHRLFHLKEVK